MTLRTSEARHLHNSHSARDNLYLGGKTFAAYVLLEKVFERAGKQAREGRAPQSLCPGAPPHMQAHHAQSALRAPCDRLRDATRAFMVQELGDEAGKQAALASATMAKKLNREGALAGMG